MEKSMLEAYLKGIEKLGIEIKSFKEETLSKTKIINNLNFIVKILSILFLILLFDQVSKKLNITRQTASIYLNHFADKKLLIKKKKINHYINLKFLNILIKKQLVKRN